MALAEVQERLGRVQRRPHLLPVRRRVDEVVGGARFVAPHVEEDYMRYLFASILVVSLFK